MDYLIVELNRLEPYFYFIYISILLGVLINTLFIEIDSKNSIKFRACIYFLANVLLSLAMIAGCIINVLIMDTAKIIYDVFNTINNRLLYISIAAVFLCLVNIITIIYYRGHHKNTRMFHNR